MEDLMVSGRPASAPPPALRACARTRSASKSMMAFRAGFRRSIRRMCSSASSNGEILRCSSSASCATAGKSVTFIPELWTAAGHDRYAAEGIRGSACVHMDGGAAGLPARVNVPAFRSRDVKLLRSLRGFYHPRPIEVPFDLLQRLSLCLRQEERHSYQVNDGEAGKEKEHRGVAVFADYRQKDSCQCGRDQLIDYEGDAHAIGPNACWHKFREREPYAYPWAQGIERYEQVQPGSDQPSVADTGHSPNQRPVDL